MSLIGSLNEGHGDHVDCMRRLGVALVFGHADMLEPGENGQVDFEWILTLGAVGAGWTFIDRIVEDRLSRNSQFPSCSFVLKERQVD